MKTKFIIPLFVIFSFVSSLSAQNYIAVAKDGNVYDDANAKYITVNQDNVDIAVIPGMVFETSQHTPGWYKIEYSPGLHAFIPEQIIASNFKEVMPGNYDIKNLPGKKVNITKDGVNWSASMDGKSFKGSQFEDIVVFFNDSKNVVFSLVDLGNGPVAITYDNSVTKFF